MYSLITKIATFHFLSAVFLSAAASTTFDKNANNHVALYWGQNSAGSQKSLATYCQSGEADIFLLSFLYEFPDPLNVNFANACTDSYADGTLKCTQIAEDIKTCQSLGKKVLLSMGGASGAYGFSDDDTAVAFASTLWNTFGEGSADERPFGDAVVDGFDFDIENNINIGYAALTTELRSIFADQGSKEYYISAAPQCVYPDAGVGNLLLNADVDFAFIQFYNNYCNVGANFNWDTWTDFASNSAFNKDIKLFLGLPGSASGAGSGYISDLSLVDSTVANMAQDSHFGGVMLWDASQGYANIVDGENYVVNMKNIVDKYATSSTSSSSSSSSATTSAKSTSAALSAASTKSSATTSASKSKSTSTTASSTSSKSSSSTTSAASSTSSTFSAATASSTSINASSSSTIKTQTTTSVFFSSSTFSTTTRNWDEPLTTETVTLANGQVTTSHIWWLPETTTYAAATTATTGRNWDEPLTTETVTLANGQVTTSHIWWLPETTVSFTSASTTASTTKSTTTLAPTRASTTSTLSSSKATTTAASSTVTAASTASATSSAQASAIALNEQYAAGKMSGKDTCSTGDMACDAEGRFALCANGVWSYFDCSAGTTCFAYTSNEEVLLGCNWSSVKSQFI
ncbi:hypothetical protein ACO0QE_003475 [Hanseniaspora vineae]